MCISIEWHTKFKNTYTITIIIIVLQIPISKSLVTMIIKLFKHCLKYFLNKLLEIELLLTCLDLILLK